jgi:hypothetical protein
MSNIIQFNDTSFKSNISNNIINNNSKFNKEILFNNDNNNNDNQNFILNKTLALKDFRKFIITLNDKKKFYKDIKNLSDKYIQKIKIDYENKYKYILESNPNTNSNDYKNSIKSLNKSILNKIHNLKFINEYNQKILKNIDNKIYIDNNIFIKDFIFDNSFFSKNFIWNKIIEYYVYYFQQKKKDIKPEVIFYSILYRLYTYLILNKFKFNYHNTSGGKYFDKNLPKNKKNKSYNYVNINSLLTFKDITKSISEFIKNKNFWMIDPFFDSLKFKSSNKKEIKNKKAGSFNKSYYPKNKNNKFNDNSYILNIYKQLIDKNNNFTKISNNDQNLFYTYNTSLSSYFLKLIIYNEDKDNQNTIDIDYGLNYFTNKYINKYFYSLIYLLKKNEILNINKVNRLNIEFQEYISFKDFSKKTVFNSYFDSFNNKLIEFYKFIENNIDNNNFKTNLLEKFKECYKDLNEKNDNIETINNAFNNFYNNIQNKDIIFQYNYSKSTTIPNKKKHNKKIPNEYRKILLYLYLLKNCKEFTFGNEDYNIVFEKNSIKNFEYIATIMCYLTFLENRNKLLIDLLRIQYNRDLQYNYEEPVSVILNYISFIHTFNLFTYTNLVIEFDNFCIDCDSNKNNKKINNVLSTNNFYNSNISQMNDIFNSYTKSNNISNAKLKIQNKINKLREKYKGTNKEKIINKIEQNYLSKFEGL